jgi:hypothetical protein
VGPGSEEGEGVDVVFGEVVDFGGEVVGGDEEGFVGWHLSQDVGGGESDALFAGGDRSAGEGADVVGGGEGGGAFVAEDLAGPVDGGGVFGAAEDEDVAGVAEDGAGVVAVGFADLGDVLPDGDEEDAGGGEGGEVFGEPGEGGVADLVEEHDEWWVQGAVEVDVAVGGVEDGGDGGGEDGAELALFLGWGGDEQGVVAGAGEEPVEVGELPG